METVVTPAIVLSALDYQESSRIFRLLTRDLGVQSVLARSARTSRKRFGAALDLFAEGTAEVQLRAGRDLHTLGAFEVQRVRTGLAGDLDRFAAASALAEVAARVVGEEAAESAFDEVRDALDALAAARGTRAHTAALRGLWRLVGVLGFAPALSSCAECARPVPADAEVVFGAAAGGVRCATCAAAAGGGRRLPPEARATLEGWLAAEGGAGVLDRPTVRAHQRLLREFIGHHLLDPRSLRAWAAWERQAAEPDTTAGV